MTARVRVEPLGVEFELQPGETLMAAAQRSGYYWPTICKGNAQCNRCAVSVVDGTGLLPYSPVELAGLRNVRWRDGPEDHTDRLACQLSRRECRSDRGEERGPPCRMKDVMTCC